MDPKLRRVRPSRPHLLSPWARTWVDPRPVENAFGRTISQASLTPVEIRALALTTAGITKAIRMAGNVNRMLD